MCMFSVGEINKKVAYVTNTTPGHHPWTVEVQPVERRMQGFLYTMAERGKGIAF